MDPRQDADETIALATIVAGEDGTLLVRPPDAGGDDETYSRTIDLGWMNLGTVLHHGATLPPPMDGATASEPAAPAPADEATPRRETLLDPDDRGTAAAPDSRQGTRVETAEAEAGTARDTSPGRPTAGASPRTQLEGPPPAGPRDTSPERPAARREEDGRAQSTQRFELLGEVGKGAMGEVLLVRDRGLWRRVAFKRLLPELSGNRGVVSRFFSEAQVTAQLDHPNIVPIYELDASSERGLGYTMKLVRGETLTKIIARDRQRLEEDGRRGEPKRLAARLALFLDVCDAIAYAHGKRVLHRDLKPDNIMVGDLGEVYVMDWGIFRLLDGDGVDPAADDDGDAAVTTTGSHGRTQFGAIIGTPAWMSPEQASGRIPDLGPASDQYALGLILHALVTLRPPRPRDALEVTLRRAREGELAPIAHEHGGGRVARELQAIIRRATALDPAARYPDVEALADDVRAYLRGDAVATKKDTPLQAFARTLAKHKFWAASAVMVLFFAGIAAAAVLQVLAEKRQEAVERYLEAVDRRVMDAGVALHGFEVGAVRLAGQVAVAAASDVTDPPPVYESADFDAKRVPDLWPSTCWIEAGAPQRPVAVSLTSPVLKLSPGADRARALPSMRQLASQGRALSDLLRRPAGDGPPATDAQVRACQTPVRRTFATLAVPDLGGAPGTRLGVHASFPGVGGYCDAYDGLSRPKYTAVTSPRDAVVWGPSVYPDRYGAGLLASVSAPVLDARGEQVGVAGLELTLSWLVERLLREPESPHVREAFLVTARGNVIARQAGFDPEPMRRLAEDFDPCAEHGAHRAPEDELEPLPIVTVRERILAGDADGQARCDLHDDEVFAVYRRISSTGWYYVTAVDESELP